ncbi:ABC transporter permease [Subtercola sp. YIM 133946]|uniref:ABC transporter permease n=1 Tax=Subtercola sp. YIM 133946 TaxID=3118909 RepID=UPI002F93FFCD
MSAVTHALVRGRSAEARPARFQTGWELPAGITILVVLVLTSVFVPVISPYDPNALSASILQGPSAAHLFGTDQYGRDLLVRVALSIRLDYSIAIVGVGFSLVVGTTLGVLAGSARRSIWGTLLMRATDAIISIPFILLVLLIVLSIGPTWSPLGIPQGVPALMIAIFLTGWPIFARISRTQATSVMSEDFILSAQLMGYSKRRIVFKHVVPNVSSQVLTYAMTDCIMIIALTGGLAFLGAGVLPPTPELGSIMNEGKSIITTAPWVTFFPACAILLSAIAVSLSVNGILNRQNQK